MKTKQKALGSFRAVQRLTVKLEFKWTLYAAKSHKAQQKSLVKNPTQIELPFTGLRQYFCCGFSSKRFMSIFFFLICLVSLGFSVMDPFSRILTSVVIDAGDFHCSKSHRCVPMIWFCDGEDDCGTGEDEPEGCGKIFKDIFVSTKYYCCFLFLHRKSVL